jgi:hypothetical protein
MGHMTQKETEMKTIAIILLCMAAACASESPNETATAQGLCTIDDPDCGPPGTDPVLGYVNATTYNNYAANPGVDWGTDRISCWNCDSSCFPTTPHYCILGEQP